MGGLGGPGFRFFTGVGAPGFGFSRAGAPGFGLSLFFSRGSRGQGSGFSLFFFSLARGARVRDFHWRLEGPGFGFFTGLECCAREGWGKIESSQGQGSGFSRAGSGG